MKPSKVITMILVMVICLQWLQLDSTGLTAYIAQDTEINETQTVIKNDSLTRTEIWDFKSDGLQAYDTTDENLNLNKYNAVTQGAMPCLGNPKILVFYTEFTGGDANWTQSAEQVEKMFFSEEMKTIPEGKQAYGEEDSLRSYYYRSSNGKVDITGAVYDYSTKFDTTYYTSAEMVMDEIISYYRDKINWDEYDTNNDGYIDGIYLIARTKHSFGGPNFVGSYEIQIGTKKTCKLCFIDAEIFAVLLHETCHMFGPADMYKAVCANPDGIRTASFMEDGYGDLPSPTKYVLGWLENVHYVTESDSISLSSYSRSGDVIIVYPEGDSSNRNWFFIEYVTNEGNNIDYSESGYGVRIWRTQMNLDEYGNINGSTEYCYGMPNSPYEFLEPIQPWGEYNTYYTSGETISPYKYPSTAYSDTFNIARGVKTLKELTFSGITVDIGAFTPEAAEITITMSDTADLTPVAASAVFHDIYSDSSFIDSSEKVKIATVSADVELKTVGQPYLICENSDETLSLLPELTVTGTDVCVYINRQDLPKIDRSKKYKLVSEDAIFTYYGAPVQIEGVDEYRLLNNLPTPTMSTDDAVKETGGTMFFTFELSYYKETQDMLKSIYYDDIVCKLVMSTIDITSGQANQKALTVPEEVLNEVNSHYQSLKTWKKDGYYYVLVQGTRTVILCYDKHGEFIDSLFPTDPYYFIGYDENSFVFNRTDFYVYEIVMKDNKLEFVYESFLNSYLGTLSPPGYRYPGEYTKLKIRETEDKSYCISETDSFNMVSENGNKRISFNEYPEYENLLYCIYSYTYDNKIYLFRSDKDLTLYTYDYDFNLISETILLKNLMDSCWGPLSFKASLVNGEYWGISIDTILNSNPSPYPSTLFFTFDLDGNLISYFKYGDYSFRFYVDVVFLDNENIFLANQNIWFTVPLKGAYSCSCSHIGARKVDAVLPTYKENGYTEGMYCDACRTFISGHQLVPKLTNHDLTNDLNGDNRTDLFDLIILTNRLNTEDRACDYDGDGKVTVDDAKMLLSVILNA